VLCAACSLSHLFNKSTGRLMGEAASKVDRGAITKRTCQTPPSDVFRKCTKFLICSYRADGAGLFPWLVAGLEKRSGLFWLEAMAPFCSRHNSRLIKIKQLRPIEFGLWIVH
jgi:hypothetical protein